MTAPEKPLDPQELSRVVPGISQAVRELHALMEQVRQDYLQQSGPARRPLSDEVIFALRQLRERLADQAELIARRLPLACELLGIEASPEAVPLDMGFLDDGTWFGGITPQLVHVITGSLKQDPQVRQRDKGYWSRFGGQAPDSQA